MKKSEPVRTENYTEHPNPYKVLGDQVGLSEVTIRNAFKGKPVTWQTACRIARHARMPIECFRIKDDNRGKKK